MFELGRSELSRHERLQREAASLKGSLDTLVAREHVLKIDVSTAKARTALKPEVDAVIEELQKRAHDRSVGSFERMLTGITDDVLPDYRGRRQVKLELSNERNMPALDIYVDNQGNREEITSGAVANVVSTGLRFISLARSGARRLLVLDEADCWIDGVAVQNYFNVVNQLSRDAGIQTVVITHHNLSTFSEDFRIYRIADIDSPDGIDARSMDLVSPGRMEPNELNPNHISFVTARNVEGYLNTGIELSPGVTVIQGANQRGKSAWRRMFDAALMADAGESIIRHKSDTAEIAVGFADGRVLEYQRFRKGATKAEFAMHSPESWSERQAGASLKSMRDGPVVPLHHTVGAKRPEWLPGETGVYEVDGINIQLWGQFSPVFMLDKPASSRAALLSIGRESGYLYAMSETYKTDLKEDSNTISKGEKEIAAIRGTTKEMVTLPELIERMDTLQKEAIEINEEARTINELGRMVEQLLTVRERIKDMDRQIEAGRFLVDAPEVQATAMVQTWLRDFTKATLDASIEITASAPDVPVVLETTVAQGVIQGMATARHFEQMGEALPTVPQTPEVALTANIQTMLFRLDEARANASVIALEPLPAIPEIEKTTEVEFLLERLQQAQQASSVTLGKVLPEPPAVEDSAEIGALLQSLHGAIRNVTLHDKELRTLQDQLAQLEQELKDATEALGGECPVCHSIMTVEMLMGVDSGGHTHANTPTGSQAVLVPAALSPVHLRDCPAIDLPRCTEPVEKLAPVVTLPLVPLDQLARASAAAAVVGLDKPASSPTRMKFRR